MPTLGKLIAQPMADETPPILTMQQKIDRWMINEGMSQMLKGANSQEVEECITPCENTSNL
jgi:hypothetical protein